MGSKRAEKQREWEQVRRDILDNSSYQMNHFAISDEFIQNHIIGNQIYNVISLAHQVLSLSKKLEDASFELAGKWNSLIESPRL